MGQPLQQALFKEPKYLLYSSINRRDALLANSGLVIAAAHPPSKQQHRHPTVTLANNLSGAGFSNGYPSKETWFMTGQDDTIEVNLHTPG